MAYLNLPLLLTATTSGYILPAAVAIRQILRGEALQLLFERSGFLLIGRETHLCEQLRMGQLEQLLVLGE